MKKTLILFVFYFSYLNISIASYGCDFNFLSYALNAEIIVVGKVIGVEKFFDEIHQRETTKIKILPAKILKGNVGQDTLNMFYYNSYDKSELNQILEKKTNQLIYCFKSHRNKNQTVYTNSCLIKRVDKTTEIRYVKNIKKLLGIAAIEKDKERVSLFVDWAIDCLSDSIMAYSGIQVLSQGGILYQYDGKLNTYKRIKKYRLKKIQKERLLDYLVWKEWYQFYDIAIVDLVGKSSKKVLLYLLKHQLIKTDLYKPIWWREFNIMRKIAQISKNKYLLDLIGEIERLGIYSKDKRLNELAREFRVRM
ncbi:MAG: hypothetical protein AB8F74_09765 [Saprospiraceae bacterium]